VKRSHVDLFSGIGGFSLACEWAGVETIAFSEIDDYASRVLKRHWPNVRNYGDVRKFPRISAWLLTAGVPCQPASVAGKRKGSEDDRWLWPQALAVVENGSYEWLLFENPTGILSLNDGLEFERVCLAVEGQGYEVQPLVIPACGVGALHRRNRVWIVAHSTRQRWGERRQRRFDSGSEGQREQALSPLADSECGGRRESSGTPSATRQPLCTSEREEGAFELGSGSKDVAPPYRRRREQCDQDQRSVRVVNSGCDVSDSEPARLEGDECRELAEQGARTFDANITGSTWWSVEPDVGRLANGVPDRVGKLRGLGNAIVPQVAYQLIKRMIEAEEP
jgi:DNA (cytosine-5)-methyltransferase 1